jgi:HK97 gp10 family phage protein
VPNLADIVSSIGIPAELQRQMSGSHYEGGVTVTTSVKGLAELEAALEQLPEKVARGVLVTAVTQATEAFRQRAIELAPYDPDKKEGMHLVDGIRKEIRVGSHSVKGAWVHGKVGLHPDVFYGRFIEFGWTSAKSGHSIAASPFMRPAFDDEKFRALAIISQQLAAGIESAARELHRQ